MSDEVSKPAWMLPGGLGGDMKGDPRPVSNFIRFWMKEGEKRKIIFLTEESDFIIIWEHNFQLAGNWGNFVTCCKPAFKECPFCDFADFNKGKFGRYKAAIGTVIDTHEFVVKDKKTGAETKKSNQKKLYVAKGKTAEILKNKADNRKEMSGGKTGLKFAMYQVYRTTGENSCAVGNDFDFVKDIDPSLISDPKELDYVKLLAPDLNRAKRMLEMVTKGFSSAGFTKAGSGGPSEDTSEIAGVESKPISY